MENTNLNEDLNLLQERISDLRGNEWEILIQEDRLGELAVDMAKQLADQLIVTNQNLKDLVEAGSKTNRTLAMAVKNLGDQQNALHNHVGILVSMVKALQMRLDHMEANQ
jgi:polyhydroxyalkanoate synthesis regulator phasin